MSQEYSKRSVEHLLTLARRGKHPASSGGEKQARKLVQCVLNHAIGLDSQATDGIGKLAKFIQASPQDGTQAVRRMIQ